MIDLTATAGLSRLYADPSRLRLLALLAREELTVAELTTITGLTQSRVSSHLATLRRSGLLRQRRDGTSTYHALDEAGMPAEARRLWGALSGMLADGALDEDRERLTTALRQRHRSWVESVAGRMERHYSPGRTWESAARSLAGLAELGDVLDVASGDGALAELIARSARSVTCLDVSEPVVRAARDRMARFPAVRIVRGDMHALPCPDRVFDHVLLVNSLSHAPDPVAVTEEAARVLRPGGRLVASTLAAHRHRSVATRYDHVQTGFAVEGLAALFAGAGLEVTFCDVTSRERRAPHFRIVTLYARRPPAPEDDR